MSSSIAGPSIDTARRSKRRRIRKACEVCRRAKVKCDGAFPCQHCVDFEFECHYSNQEETTATSLRTQHRPDSEPKIASAQPVLQDTPVAEWPANQTSNHRPLASWQRGDPWLEASEASDVAAFDPAKSRFMSASSYVAFPQSVGERLGRRFIPRLHAFGYNMGVRPEETPAVNLNLRQITSNDDLQRYSEVYFKVVAPIFDIVEARTFRNRAIAYLDTQSQAHFGAVIASIVALGSFFSSSAGHPREMELVEHAKRVLDDPHAIRRPSVDLVVGWVLRTIYLRATTRPNNAWLSSCITMHLAEATGLHNESCLQKYAEMQKKRKIGDVEPDCESFRTIFWTAWSLHTITAFEYGRGCAAPLHFTCKAPQVQHENTTPSQEYLQLARIVPSLAIQLDSMTHAQALETTVRGFADLTEASSTHPFIVATKADLFFCFYRRLRQQRLSMTPALVARLVTAGNESIRAASELTTARLPWWNVLGTNFQYLCVLLALDTSTSIENVAVAYQGLEVLAETYNTRMAREALDTAQRLVGASIAKKNEESGKMSIVMPSSPRISPGDEESLLPPDETNTFVDWDTMFGDVSVEALPNYSMVLEDEVEDSRLDDR